MLRTALVRVLCVAGIGALLLSPAADLTAQTPTTYEGFGAATPGGSGKPVYHVTNLNNSGSGSLRDALSLGNRTVVFDVGGDIVLSDEVTLKSAFVTVDGLSAPFPGVTLKNFGLIIRGTAGHDIIVRGLRIRDAFQDGIWVTDAAYNVVIDHVSVHNSGDGNLDITREGTRDITVSWSILAEPAGEEKNMLLAFKQSRITLHHNLFIDSAQRSPQVTYDDSAERAQDTDTTLDMRNNLVWNWRGGYGSRIRYGGQANVVDNFYAADGGDASDALIICKGLAVDSQCYDDTTNVARAYVSGNFSADGVNLNNRGTQSFPFPASPVTTQDPRVAACQVRDGAGVRPLDPIDQHYLSTISLPACTPPPTCTHVAPTVGVTSSATGGVSAGTKVTYTVSVTNKDVSPCTASTFNLGASAPSGWTLAWGPTSLSIAPGASASTTLSVTSPTTAASATYTITGSATNAGAPSASAPFSATYVVSSPGGGGTAANFSDDFNRAESTNLGTAWTEVSGDLVLKGNTLKNALGMASHKAVVSTLSGATQTVSADFMSPNNNQGPVFGLLLRYQNPTNYYVAYRQVGGSAVLRIAKVVNGTATVLATAALANPQVNVPFKLTARVSGTKISLDLNGVNKVNATDTTFPTGKVGIQINSSSTSTQYQGDNFTASVQ